MCSYGIFDSLCPTLRLSPFENKIGGHPDFYSDCLLTSAPSCESCHAPLVLLVQIYCPLEGSRYHRLLHIFCCTQSTCSIKSQSWLVLRSQYTDPTWSGQQEREAQGAESNSRSVLTEWCQEAENWASDEEEMCVKEKPPCPAERLTSALEGMAISQPCETITARTSDNKPCTPPYEGPCYPPAYISTVEENTCSPQTTEATRLLERYSAENPSYLSGVDVEEGRRGKSKEPARGKRGKSGGGGGGGEQYEKPQVRHGDKHFLKFQKELLKCPQQIIRYCWKGEPVLLTDKSTFTLPPDAKLCGTCGSPRVFECQLMPTLVYTLQTRLQQQAQSTLPAVEFGTVLIYCCSESCWNNKTDLKTFNFRNESAIVQSEST